MRSPGLGPDASMLPTNTCCLVCVPTLQKLGRVPKFSLAGRSPSGMEVGTGLSPC